jgi:predicted alpha/beta hydrolase family esterase
MKRQILFIHSAGEQGPSAGSGPLVAALQRGLGPEYRLLHPLMPHPEAPEYQPWKLGLATALAGLSGEVTLIGHSLGGSVLVKYLAEEGWAGAITSLCLIAAPYFGAPDWEHAEFMLDPAAAPPRLPRVCLYYTRDDAVVAPAHLALYAAMFPQATARELDGYGHTFSAGCAELVADLRAGRA